MHNRYQAITLVGAGLTGPLLAISLVQRGFRVQIYERRPDMRRVRVSAGRSINLAISTRGIHALREAGLWDEMRRIIVPMKGRMMHSLAGELTFQPYGKDDTRGHQFDFARRSEYRADERGGGCAASPFISANAASDSTLRPEPHVFATKKPATRDSSSSPMP